MFGFLLAFFRARNGCAHDAFDADGLGSFRRCPIEVGDLREDL